MADASSTAALKGTNVQVAVRCRPVNAEEKKTGQASVVTCDLENKAIKVAYGPAGKKIMKSFNFDKVFGAYSRQEEVFESIVKPIVDETLAGFNCTIFAYGQTGTGKTHTMEGDINSEEDAGIVPRSVKYILEQLESSGSEYTIRVSFLELYNEELADLLNTSGEKKLKLCEDAKKGVVCQNLEEVTVLNVTDIFEILQRGIQQRQVAATLCNKNSSRSHSIFTLKIMIKEVNVEGEEVVRHGQLNLVDLAGSECIGRSGAKDNRAREAGSINQSLLTLGRVITALVDHHGHIPYRDSKLTRLLQESLGGKAKTCIIATLSPSQSAVEETMSTLDYAYRAKNIKNQPTQNQRSTKKLVMKEYFQEIETLKMQLQLTREKNGVYVDPAEYYGMETRLATQEAQIAECEATLKIRNEEFKYIKAEKEDLTQRLEASTEECERLTSSLEESRTSLSKVKGELTTSYVELKATEAVVTEQSATEQLLHRQSEKLSEDLTHRQADVDRLLGKVDRLNEKETERLMNTKAFVGSLTSSSGHLVEQVTQLAGQSKEHSVTLCAGVATILSKGRSTCDSLKSSIDAALSTMTSDAESARDSMTTSCTDLKTHLQNTNTGLESTLRSLQSQLSAWLVEVDDSLKEAQQHLNLQQRQIDATIASVDKNCSALREQNLAFVASQEAFASESVNQVNDLKVELKFRLDAYQKQSEQTMRDASVALKNKAEAMENAMKLMLKDIITSSSEAMEVVVNNASTVVSETQTMMDSGMAKTVGNFNASVDALGAHSRAVLLGLDTTKHTFTSDIHAVQKSREQSHGTLSSVSETVGSKRKFLEDTVSSVVVNVDKAIVEGCAVVESTSETANKILRDVNSAAVRMNESASASMHSFTAYMNQEGDNISSELGKHFSTVVAHLNSQRTGLEGIHSSAVSHGDSIAATELRPTGTTPKKTIFLPRELVAPTRAHAEIRSETRDQLMLSDAVGYEAVSAAIASNYAAAQLPTSRAESPSVVDEAPTAAAAAGAPLVKTLSVDTVISGDENAAPNSLSSATTGAAVRPLSTRGGKGKSSTASATELKSVAASRTRSSAAVDLSEGI